MNLFLVILSLLAFPILGSSTAAIAIGSHSIVDTLSSIAFAVETPEAVGAAEAEVAQSPPHCVSCTESVGSGSPGFTCPAGHLTCKDCVDGLVGALMDNPAALERLSDNGLACPHRELGRHGAAIVCGHSAPFDGVIGLLDIERLAEMHCILTEVGQARVAAAAALGAAHTATAGGTSGAAEATVEEGEAALVRKLQSGIEEAFNLRCPGAGCGGILDQIEGCNAAKCDSCNSKFCYLCLQPGASSTAVHAHARAHAGNFWDHRDGHTGLCPDGVPYQEIESYEVLESHSPSGKKRKVRVDKPYKYTDRYHWLLARKKLDSLFLDGVDALTFAAQVKEKALAAEKTFLMKNKMWPLPITDDTAEWIREVNEEPSLDGKNQIALLQNEYIFQLKASKQSYWSWLFQFATECGVRTRIGLIKSELKKRGVKILNSLDVRDAGQPPSRAVDAFGPGLQPVQEDHPRYGALSAQFKELGSMYSFHVPVHRIPASHGEPPRDVLEQTLILSGAAPFEFTQEGAVAYCRDTVGGGARLPTKWELIALSRAMGSLQPEFRAPGYNVDGYRPNDIPDMSNRRFWSETCHRDFDEFAFILNGSAGRVGVELLSVDASVRCVFTAHGL